MEKYTHEKNLLQCLTTTTKMRYSTGGRKKWDMFITTITKKIVHSYPLHRWWWWWADEQRQPQSVIGTVDDYDDVAEIQLFKQMWNKEATAF